MKRIFGSLVCLALLSSTHGAFADDDEPRRDAKHGDAAGSDEDDDDDSADDESNDDDDQDAADDEGRHNEPARQGHSRHRNDRAHERRAARQRRHAKRQHAQQDEEPSEPKPKPDPLAGRIWPEPWSDNDPGFGPSRLAIGKSGLGIRAGLEYRAIGTYIAPLNLNSDYDTRASWFEHRLRLDTTVDYQDKVKIVVSVDALEGVLWGDNGTFGGNPSSVSGAHVNTTNVNSARLCTVQWNAQAPVDPQSYRLGLCPADPLSVRRAYGEVLTPIGLLRVGRQSFTLGAGVAVNDGDGRKNRFGVAYRGNTVDRILFATKPLEGFKAKSERDITDSNGLFLILAFDKLVNGKPMQLNDDLQEWTTALRYLRPDHALGKDLEGRLSHTYRWDSQYGTKIHAFNGRLTNRMGSFYAGIDAAAVLGETREVSEAFHLISNDPVVSQPIRQIGARGVVRYDKPKFSLYLEGDYASGDSDPSSGSALTQYSFGEDTNVGLLMFKQTLAYQTARVAAAATELLKNLNSPSLPVDAIATKGRFTNAFAIFPQADFRPIPNLLFRAGVLVAWAPAKVNDPVASQQRKQGGTIDNDLVNFVGGQPGRFYGAEIDGRVQWRFKEHFIFDLEGAILFPGTAFQDKNGYAVRSGMVQGRTTFVF